MREVVQGLDEGGPEEEVVQGPDKGGCSGSR